MLLKNELFNLRFENIDYIRSKFELLFHGRRQLQVLIKLLLFLNFLEVCFILFLDIFHRVLVSSPLILIFLISVDEAHSIDLVSIHLWTSSSNLILIGSSSSIGKNLLFLSRGSNATISNQSTIETNESTFGLILTNSFLFAILAIFIDSIIINNLIRLRWDLFVFAL